MKVSYNLVRGSTTKCMVVKCEPNEISLRTSQMSTSVSELKSSLIRCSNRELNQPAILSNIPWKVWHRMKLACSHVGCSMKVVAQNEVSLQSCQEFHKRCGTEWSQPTVLLGVPWKVWHRMEQDCHPDSSPWKVWQRMKSAWHSVRCSLKGVAQNEVILQSCQVFHQRCGIEWSHTAILLCVLRKEVWQGMKSACHGRYSMKGSVTMKSACHHVRCSMKGGCDKKQSQPAKTLGVPQKVACDTEWVNLPSCWVFH